MSTLTSGFTRHLRGDSGREVRWGVLGVLAVVALLVVCGVLYVLPLGKSSYTALLSEAGSVKVGDEVRVAGITVGSVTGLELLPDQVRMRFTVDHQVFVGDASTLDIRMLTAVGGHYLAMTPSGSKPLGAQPIPADRVRLPYSLMRTFQDAAAPVEQVDGDALRRNLAAVRRSLADNPDSIRRLSDAMDTVVGIFDKQRTDIAAALSAADEYLSTIDAGKSAIGGLIRHIGSVETILIDKRDEINAAVPLTIRFVSRIAALEPGYRTSLQPLVDEFARALPELQRLGQRLDEMITTVDGLTTHLRQVAAQQGVTIDQSATTLSTICVPLPGKGC
ncbi:MULTISPECIES: MlaD family protein [unclassified Nocardia]|uniref:MlaD family protein n=1 Tax=unclassified Nocardia TaxID=2637762 RepID=UPI001CE3FA25|nr:MULTISPECIES: MlaD family protein [unclassified Nocardia]